MNETYFVIYNSDGETTVSELTKEQLLKAIQENHWGHMGILGSCPSEDTNYWGENILIIKGKVVTPQPKEVITKYDVE